MRQKHTQDRSPVHDGIHTHSKGQLKGSSQHDVCVLLDCGKILGTLGEEADSQGPGLKPTSDAVKRLSPAAGR